MKKFRISLRYAPCCPACLLVTAACGIILWQWRSAGVIPMLVFFKSLTLLLLLYFSATLRPHESYYYHNLGISKARLWATAATVDLAIFSVVIFLIYNLFAR